MLLLGGLSFISAARSDTLDNFGELQKALSVGKFADAEQQATQMLANDPDSPLAGRVRAARARSRIGQGRVPEAVEDYLAAIERAESDQRKAAVDLELASAMQRLQFGDHACAAIRRAVDIAGEESPLGQVATARSRESGCPNFADQDFDRLFQTPFVLSGTTEGKLSPIFAGAAAVRFPNEWAVDETPSATADSANLSSRAKDAVCAIRRTDGTPPIKDYLEAVGKEPYARGRRPDGILRGVVGREARMGSARAVEIDFGAGSIPGRLYVATRLNKTYSVLCLSLGPDAPARMREAARMIAETMRWGS
jgi:tetratricopeptide (TPR) repeat protein